MNFFKILSLTLLLVTTSCKEKHACIRTIAALDLGSGSTKLKVAKVDICHGRIEQVLLKKNQAIAFKEELQQSNQHFSKKFQLKALNSLEKIIKSANQHSPDHWRAVATSAFRSAQNANEFIDLILKTYSIPVNIISQEKEAMIGFRSVLASTHDDPEKILVWDIGGGSMQMSFLEWPEGQYFYLGDLASVSFKKRIIEEIQKKDPKKHLSPNPLGKQTIAPMLSMASLHARKNVSKDFLKRSKGKKVIGIGGVHFHSLGKKIPKSYYNQVDLFQLLEKSVDLNDEQIASKYAATDVTNIALVLGHMKAFGIEQVYPMEINMTDGILLFKDW